MGSPEATILRLTEGQHAQLRTHLFPGDGRESVALALCGTHRSGTRTLFCVHAVKPVPNEACLSRSAEQVVWPMEPFVPLFAEAARKHMAVLKIHSHPTGYARFSALDDKADRALLGSLAGGVGLWSSYVFDTPAGPSVAGAACVLFVFTHALARWR